MSVFKPRQISCAILRELMSVIVTAEDLDHQYPALIRCIAQGRDRYELLRAILAVNAMEQIRPSQLEGYQFFRRILCQCGYILQLIRAGVPNNLADTLWAMARGGAHPICLLAHVSQRCRAAAVREQNLAMVRNMLRPPGSYGARAILVTAYTIPCYSTEPRLEGQGRAATEPAVGGAGDGVMRHEKHQCHNRRESSPHQCMHQTFMFFYSGTGNKNNDELMMEMHTQQ